MSARSLPAHPSLRHLKAEAKQFHKAVVSGDADAAERMRANLRRLSHGDSIDDVTLQEAQHVLGREYGFLDWQGLAAAPNSPSKTLPTCRARTCTGCCAKSDRPR